MIGSREFKPRVSEGAAAGAMLLGFLGTAGALTYQWFGPRPPSADDLTLGGVCALGPFFTFMGGVLGAIGAVAGNARRGGLICALVAAAPVLFYITACIVVSPRGGVELARQFLATALVLSIAGAIAGAIGSVAANRR